MFEGRPDFFDRDIIQQSVALRVSFVLYQIVFEKKWLMNRHIFVKLRHQVRIVVIKKNLY